MSVQRVCLVLARHTQFDWVQHVPTSPDDWLRRMMVTITRMVCCQCMLKMTSRTMMIMMMRILIAQTMVMTIEDYPENRE